VPECRASWIPRGDPYTRQVLRRRQGRPNASRERRTDGADAFRRTVAHVEEAKLSLASAAPSGRSEGRPLAQAVAEYEHWLVVASRSLVFWPSPLEAELAACRRALEEAARRSERLRLEESPHGYEELYGLLAELMEPLDAFTGAQERVEAMEGRLRDS
jgi:hypothetical protein